MSNVFRATFTVKADTAIDQFSPVKLDDGELVPTAAIDDECIGTIEDGAEGGELRAVNMMGQCPVKVDTSDTAIEPGDYLTPGADGKAVKDAGTGARRTFAEALEGSDEEDGAVIYCMVGRVFEDHAE